MTLTGHASDPGHLSRIGPITAAQARELADYAVRDAAASWRVVLVNELGQAIAVAKVRRPGRGASADLGGSAGPTWSGGPTWSAAGRVTVIVTEAELLAPPAFTSAIIAQIITAAASAASAALAAIAPEGGCSHAAATTAYRPPPSLREYVTARDFTCRYPTCRRPAIQSDLDHTIPYDQGGRTCSCNLGGMCRFHHQLKQHLRWHLAQTSPGVFQWTTPTGRTYTTVPDAY